MKKELKTFILKMAVFSAPFIIMLIIAILLDPLKIWFDYDDYNKNYFATLNREWVCLKLFEKNIEKVGYNSYILGSSRSLAFKIPEWEKHLEAGAVGFHFDASGEGIYGIYNKIKYIKKRKLPIYNALIIIDHAIMMEKTKNRMGYLYISPPELSGESKIVFYKEFLRANFDPAFMAGYIDYNIFHKHRGYMINLLNVNGAKYAHVFNNVTGDYYFGYDKMIEEDMEGYYDNLKRNGTFYDRKSKELEPENPISEKEKELLEGIYKLLKENNTKCKIVISPLYNQKKLSEERVNLLKAIFGTENVYDFSGNNKYTESIYNYYEDSHYRPHIANQIMAEIYRK